MCKPNLNMADVFWVYATIDKHKNDGYTPVFVKCGMPWPLAVFMMEY